MEYTKLYYVLIECCLAMILICKSKIDGVVIKEVSQSSTNRSFEAGLACDGDLDTFSLTEYDQNQWLSAKLDKPHEIAWIFVRIKNDGFRLTVGLDDANPVTCVEIAEPSVENNDIIEKILTCTEVNTKNKIKIRNLGEGPLKVYEIKVLGTEQNDPKLYTNFTGFPQKSEALDNDLYTVFLSDTQEDPLWFLKLNSTYEIKWILISIREGSYELHVASKITSTDGTTLCKNFSFSEIKQYRAAIECIRTMQGDTIVLKKTDVGALRLFEIYPIVCAPKHYGPSCARCRESCQSCDSISGRCTQCTASFYGDLCQYRCPHHCLDLICDQTKGTCECCQDGYKGQWCELEVTTTVVNTGDVSLSTESIGSKSQIEEKYSTQYPSGSTRDISTSKPKGSSTGENNYYWAMLSTLLTLLTILVLVVIFLFSKKTLIRKYKQRRISRNDSDENMSIPWEHQSELNDTTNSLQLEEIPQNETGDIADEVITVEYVNLTSQRVPIGQFLEDLPHRKEERILGKEFDELPHGLLESYSNALKSSNRNKSRYKGIFPYDYNGVRLNTEYENNEDFVNASYIHGYNKEKAYIAAQGPFNPRTLEDFWKMIWQNNSSRIVMLTSLYEGDKMKCLKYWPDIDHIMNFGPHTITLKTEDVYDLYTLRTMSVKYEEEVRTVTQFHFTAWPDNSVPEDVTSLIRFRNLVRSNLDFIEGPMVVHCSAGIGRTGTFIALDYTLEEGATEQTVDVKGYVISLRHQRGKSIQTREQYIFLHDAVAEGLTQNSANQYDLDVM
uniref:protein-tyrosine-phosphatase n=1 Tax=Crassostrea virginica TaxID=6565 RepID=A0A8B8AZ35_CRAVI|nr:uncharacterized protein LOC111105862 isoform X2 [Crassostrea virginica]